MTHISSMRNHQLIENKARCVTGDRSQLLMRSLHVQCQRAEQDFDFFFFFLSTKPIDTERKVSQLYGRSIGRTDGWPHASH